MAVLSQMREAGTASPPSQPLFNPHLVSAYLQHKGATVTVIILPGHILENKEVSPSPGDPKGIASTSASYHTPTTPTPLTSSRNLPFEVTFPALVEINQSFFTSACRYLAICCVDGGRREVSLLISPTHEPKLCWSQAPSPGCSSETQNPTFCTNAALDPPTFCPSFPSLSKP